MVDVKVGDRLRILIEGDVDYVTEEGYLSVDHVYYSLEPSIDGNEVGIGAYGVVSIEVIAPLFVLPAKKGAQVLDGEGFLWTRHTNGDWWTSTGHWNLGERLITQCRPLHVISEGADE